MALLALVSRRFWDTHPHRALRNLLSKCAFPLVILIAVLLCSVSAIAQQQSQQQYLYASAPLGAKSVVSGFTPDQTGALTAIPNSPFPESQEGGLVAIDALGRFVFVLNTTSNDTSMFSVASDGSLTEVPGSPFAAQATVNPEMTPMSPLCLATEPSGKFLYVGYQNGNYPEHGAILEYLIDASQLSPLALAPLSIVSTDIPAIPFAMVGSPQGYLYAALRLVPGSTQADQIAGIGVFSIDPGDGQLAYIPNAGSDSPNEQAVAIDPQGKILFDGGGSNDGFIEGAPILADGTAIPSAPQKTASGSVPSAMLVDSAGQFLYVREGITLSAYSINRQTALLSPIPIASTTLSLHAGSVAADPAAPFIYSLQSGFVHVYQVDPGSGNLSESLGPYPVGSSGALGLAISGSQAQGVTGPAAAFAPASQDFATITVGQSSATKIIELINTGGQALGVQSITVTGVNAADFTASQTCPPLLQPRDSCSISIVFSPAAAGPRQATLTAGDAAGTQTAALTGTGVAPRPAVTLVPGSLSFAATNQGSTGAPQTVTVTNSGAAALHVSSAVTSGANPGDFVLANSCNAPVAVSASCSITVSFSPLGDGLRTASLMIADDAPDSPQSVALSGTGTGAPVARPGIAISPPSISFPTTTQGTASAPQVLTITSSGTSSLHISSITLAGTNSADFTIMSGCTASGYAVSTSCAVTLTFSPSAVAVGPRSASVVIADDAPNSPQMIPIGGLAQSAPATGGGPGPALTISGDFSATVAAGQTATYNLRATPGFSGTVSFTCTGVPTAAACFAPTLTVTRGTTLPLVVTVTTTGSSGSSLVSPSPPSSWPQPRTPQVPIALCALVLFACAVVITRARPRFAYVSSSPRTRRSLGLPQTAAFAAFALAVAFSAGCGGGGAVAHSAPITQPQPVVTPQGTSNIVVTPVPTPANGQPVGTVSPIQLTLTVQ